MSTSNLIFTIATKARPATPIELETHLFDARGKHIASAPIEAGRVTLRVPTARLRRASVWIGPKHASQNQDQPTLAMMRRIGAYQPSVTLQPDVPIELRIPEELWPRWKLCLTRVVGRVVRPMVIAGGQHELPVCRARIHICEADPWPILFGRLPDSQLLRLRDDLLRLHDLPQPVQLPMPVPGPKLSAGPHPLLRVGTVTPMMATLNPAELRELSETHKLLGDDLRTAPNPRITLPASLRNALSSPSAAVLREAMTLHLQTIIPLLCWWPWLWPFLHCDHCDELRVVETDDHGRFETLILHTCSGEKPDLYFWVEYPNNGPRTSVYNPPAICTTRWNYISGTEVSLRVRNPRVPWCGESQSLPGKHLHLNALATDRWGELDDLHTHAVAAFALAAY
jgi:hypothetical protein